MAPKTTLAYKKGQIFNWEKRIKSEREAYAAYYGKDDFDEYIDPYDIEGDEY